MSIKFVYSTTTVDILSDPDAGYERVGERVQAFGRTASGVVYVYDKGVRIRRWQISLIGLSAAEKTNLYNFFHNATTANPKGVLGMANTWTYTDEQGGTWTARFLSPQLNFGKIVKDAWNISFEISVEPT